MKRLRPAALAAALALLTTLPAWAGIEQVQLQAVHDLAAGTFGLMVVEPGKTPASQLESGTPNQQLLARVWYYGWALRHGSLAEQAEARSLLNGILDGQEAWGHYSRNANTDEVLTTSHFQLWAAGMSGAYLFALSFGANVGFGTPLPAPDSAVLNRVRRWWLDEKELWSRLAVGNAIDAPGARFPTAANPPVTNMGLRNTIYGQLRNIRPSSTTNWATDPFYTGAWILEELNGRGHNPAGLVAPLAGYTPRVRVHDTLCLYRSGAEWLYYFPKMRVALDPIFWVQSRAGQPHNSPLVGGQPVDPPAKPANFPGATLTQYLGLAAGAVSCPAPGALGP